MALSVSLACEYSKMPKGIPKSFQIDREIITSDRQHFIIRSRRCSLSALCKGEELCEYESHISSNARPVSFQPSTSHSSYLVKRNNCCFT